MATIATATAANDAAACQRLRGHLTYPGLQTAAEPLVCSATGFGRESPAP